MDRIKKYKKLIKETLEEHMGFPTPDFPNLQDILVIDPQQQHFISCTVGWDRGEFVYDTVYHLELKNNGKIWIYQLNSTVEIDLELIEKGVAKEDIIAAMLKPYTLPEVNKDAKQATRISDSTALSEK